MEVGYYFYSNGTYGTDYKDGSTLGIIYKNRKTETDNVIKLRRYGYRKPFMDM